MAWGYGMAAPKPEKGSSRKRRQSLRRTLDEAFRNDVWLRELAKGDGEAYCQRCGRGPLQRTRDVLARWAGHVAHLRGRRVAPEDRFNPDKAELCCRDCHMREHSMRFA